MHPKYKRIQTTDDGLWEEIHRNNRYSLSLIQVIVTTARYETLCNLIGSPLNRISFPYIHMSSYPTSWLSIDRIKSYPTNRENKMAAKS